MQYDSFQKECKIILLKKSDEATGTMGARIISCVLLVAYENALSRLYFRVVIRETTRRAVVSSEESVDSQVP